nr:hypothetical protein [Pseudomonas syringae]
MFQIKNHVETDKLNAHPSQIGFKNFVQNDITAIFRVVEAGAHRRIALTVSLNNYNFGPSNAVTGVYPDTVPGYTRLSIVTGKEYLFDHLFHSYLWHARKTRF